VGEAILGLDLRGLMLARFASQVLYHLSHSTGPVL
jgi:hypothetical protein